MLASQRAAWSASASPCFTSLRPSPPYAPLQAQKDPAIQQPVQLEQWLMEGAYNKVGWEPGKHGNARV